MTEKEKMKCGLLYDAGSDQALAKDRAACKELCHAYNQTPPSDRARREMLMLALFGSHINIDANLYLLSFSQYHYYFIFERL